MTEAEFVALAATYRDTLTRLAVRLVGVDDAEDAAQETLLRAWCHYPDLRPVGARAWLGITCRRVCLDQLRAESKRGTVPLLETAIEALDDFALVDAEELIARLTPALARGERAALAGLLRGDGADDRLTRVRLSRARARLRAMREVA